MFYSISFNFQDPQIQSRRPQNFQYYIFIFTYPISAEASILITLFNFRTCLSLFSQVVSNSSHLPIHPMICLYLHLFPTYVRISNYCGDLFNFANTISSPVGNWIGFEATLPLGDLLLASKEVENIRIQSRKFSLYSLTH